MAPHHNYSLRYERDRKKFLFYREDPLPRDTKKRPIYGIKSWSCPSSVTKTIEWFTSPSSIKPKRKPTSVTAMKRIVEHFIAECLPAKYKAKHRLEILCQLLSSLNIVGTIPMELRKDTIYEWLEFCAGSTDIGAQSCWILSKALPRIPKTWKVRNQMGFIRYVLWPAITDAKEKLDTRYLLKCFDMLCVFLEKRFRNRTVANPPPLYAFRILYILADFVYEVHEDLVELPDFVMVKLIDIAKKRKLHVLEVALREYPLKKPHKPTKEEPVRLEALAFAVVKNTYKSEEILNDELLQVAIPELMQQFRDSLPKSRGILSSPCDMVNHHRDMYCAAIRKYRYREYVYSGYDCELNFVRQSTRTAIEC